MRHPLLPRLLAAAAAAAAALAASAAAAGSAAGGSYAQDLTVALQHAPLEGKRATPVFVSCSFVSISPPRLGEKTFMADVYVYTAHRDDRITDAVIQAAGGEDALFVGSAAPAFSPRVEITNAFTAAVGGEGVPSFSVLDSPPPWVLAEEAARAGLLAGAAANASRWVVGQARHRFTVQFEPDMRDFPGEKLATGVFIESSWWSLKDVEFFAAASAAHMLSADGFSDPPGFSVEDLRIAVSPFSYDATKEVFSRFSAFFNIRRHPLFYASRLYTNCFMLVGMSLASPFLRGDGKMRWGVVAFSISCLIAWQIFLAIDDNARLPATRWFSRVELLLNLSYGACFAMIVWHSLRYGYYKSLNYLMGRRSVRDGAEYTTVKEHHHHRHQLHSHGSQRNLHDAPAVATSPAAAAPIAVHEDHRNRLSVLLCPRGRSICLGTRGAWEHVTAHRKLDLLFTAAVGAFFAIAAAILLTVGFG